MSTVFHRAPTAEQQKLWDSAKAKAFFHYMKQSKEITMTEPRSRVTKDHIDSVISEVTYFRIPASTCTICSITLITGFSVRGESACVDPALFDEALGKKYAYEKAFDKLWELEGYLLAEERYRAARGDMNQLAAAQNTARYDLLTNITELLNLGSFEEIIPAIKRTNGRMSDFGTAITCLREGLKVARKGWNGKGMFVYLVPAARYPASTEAAKGHFGANALVPYNAYFAIKNVDNTVSTWVPSVDDALAEDWEVVA